MACPCVRCVTTTARAWLHACVRVVHQRILCLRVVDVQQRHKVQRGRERHVLHGGRVANPACECGAVRHQWARVDRCPCRALRTGRARGSTCCSARSRGRLSIAAATRPSSALHGTHSSRVERTTDTCAPHATWCNTPSRRDRPAAACARCTRTELVVETVVPHARTLRLRCARRTQCTA
jgi:hypothetical protein